MSRGLSQQQRAILGLGVRINRAVNGGEVVPIPGEPVMYPHWSGPALCAPGLAEVTVRYVLHLLHKVPIKSVDEGPGFFRYTARLRSLKASTTRAVTLLCKGGHLVFLPDRRNWPGREAPERYTDAMTEWLAALPPGEALALWWGYALTPKGIEEGLKHEAPLDSVQVLEAVSRLQYDGWQFRDYMLPVLAERIAALAAAGKPKRKKAAA
jgi:hypothetical protein